MLGKSTLTAKRVLLGLGITLFLNAVFLALALQSAALSPARPIAEIERAFSTGELGDRDYLRGDWRRGDHQYNDCAVLQLVVNPAPSLVDRALAPRMYVSDESYSDVCQTLRRIVNDEGTASQRLEDIYARYWHGYLPITAALLAVTDVGTARQTLRVLLIGSLLVLMAAAATAGGIIGIAGIAVGASGLLFWALPYYGQGLSQAPGDALVIFGVAALIAWRRWLQDRSRLIAFSAAYGSLVTYLDFLTGQIPTAACLLFIFAFLSQSDRLPGASSINRRAWKSAFSAVAAFGIGSVLTVVTKQVLVIVLISSDQVEPFVSNLRYYAGLSAGADALPATYFRAFFNLAKSTILLTYYSIPAGIALLGVAALAWLGAAIFAFRSRICGGLENFLAHLVGASGIAAWVLLLPAHTEMHSGFMVRMLIVPISLGWSALAIQLLSTRQSAPATIPR